MKKKCKSKIFLREAWTVSNEEMRAKRKKKEVNRLSRCHHHHLHRWHETTVNKERDRERRFVYFGGNLKATEKNFVLTYFFWSYHIHKESFTRMKEKVWKNICIYIYNIYIYLCWHIIYSILCLLACMCDFTYYSFMLF